MPVTGLREVDLGYVMNEDYVPPVEKLDGADGAVKPWLDIVIDIEDRDALKRDVYFTAAHNTARLSRDTTKVGAVIINGNETVSEGYNGPPAVFNDEVVPKSREHGIYRTISPGGMAITCGTSKYAWVRHAEANAIRYALRRDYRLLVGARMYVTRFPCSACALSIAENGIGEVHVDLPHYVDGTSIYCVSPDNRGGMTTAPINEALAILSDAGIKVFCDGVLL